MEQKQQRMINYCRILQVLSKSTEHFQRIFKIRWLEYQRLKKNNALNEWIDSNENRLQLIDLCSSANFEMKKSIKNDNINLWDITLLSHVIQALPLGDAVNKHEDTVIKCIRKIRNKIIHGKPELTDVEFEQYFDELSKSMIELGDTHLAMDELKEALMTIVEIKTEPKSDNNKTEFKRLKNEAKKLFKDKKFTEAIDVYNKILQLPGQSSEDQALIHSNKSAAYLSFETRDSNLMAKRHADFAIKLWPRWWRGYFRLGKAEAALGNFHDAEKAFNKVLLLNSSSKEIRHELSVIYAKLDNLAREAGPSYDDMLGMSSGDDGRRQEQDPTIEHELLVSLEDIYKGSVKKMRITRKVVQPDGTEQPEYKILSMDIKPGWKSGTKITFHNEGDQLFGRIPADIAFIIKDKPHPLFIREGADIRYIQKLSLNQALCGTTVNVPTLDGTIRQLELNTAIKPNSTKILKGQGLPNPKLENQRGDLIVEFDIEFPDSLS